MADRRVSVTIDADPSPFVRGVTAAGAATKVFADRLDAADGRLSGLVQSGLALAPAFVPIGASIVPAIAGLAVQAGAAAGAVGVLALALNGTGDALTAISDFDADPTQANLDAMREQMSKLTTEGQAFVLTLDSMRPELEQLQDAAQRSALPGLTNGLREAATIGPRLTEVIQEIGAALGDIGQDAGEALTGERFARFLDYIEREARPTLTAMAETAGNLGAGLAEMMMAFDPLADDFTSGMVRMSESFRDWAASLSSSQSFAEFVSYVRSEGPQVLSTLGAIADGFVGFIRAAAPVGSIVLPALELMAQTFAAIANSPVGPVLVAAAAGIGALGRSMALLKTVGLFGGGSALVTGLTSAGVASEKAERGVAGLRKALGGLVIAEAAVLGIKALQDQMVETYDGAEKLTRGLLDLTEARDTLAADSIVEQFGDIADSLDRLNDPNFGESANDLLATIGTLGQVDSQGVREATDQINALDEAFANIVTAGSPEQAKAVMAAFAESAGLSQAQVIELTQRMPLYTAALDNADNSARLAAGAADDLGEALYGSAAATDNAARSAAAAAVEIDTQTDAMRNQRAEAIAGFDAQTRYAESLKLARDVASETSAGLNKNTEAGRENRDALSALAAAWNNQSDAFQNGAGNFRSARQDFIDTAQAMGVGEDRARNLAQRLLEIPKRVVTETTMETGRFRTAAQMVRANVDEVDRLVGEATADMDTRRFDAARGKVVNNLDVLDGSQAIPLADLNDQATSGLLGIGRTLSSLDGRTATVTTIQRTITQTLGSATPRQSDLSAGYADGGLVRGAFALGAGGFIEKPDDGTVPAMLMEVVA